MLQSLSHWPLPISSGQFTACVVFSPGFSVPDPSDPEPFSPDPSNPEPSSPDPSVPDPSRVCNATSSAMKSN